MDAFDSTILRAVCEAAGLSPAETQVAVLACQGLPTKAIAARLHCTTKTASAHRVRIIDRLDAQCWEEVIYVLHTRAVERWAREKGRTEPEPIRNNRGR